MGARYRETAPQMVELARKVETERRNLEATLTNLANRAVAEARASYEQALREERTLASNYQNLRSQFRRSQTDLSDADNLRESLKAQRSILTQLRANQQEVNVATSGQGESAIRQIAVAHAPSAPISPILRNELTSGAALGLLLGISLVLPH